MTSAVQALDLEQLRALIAEVLDVEVSDIADDTNFADDLEIDSLMALEVVVVLEKRYQVKLREEELKQVTCLKAAYDLLEQKLRTSQ
ncbi:acyl carrier protein [Streptomyces sp. ML-6]|uniref:acyl carrier protein n=1 Tax=unclassified Streptomyces TaxID=2593676 RepID=UPI0024BF13DE|nr:acyl carrier protein [Streptomyces sp. ML-6]MDK0521931.1 acyl carrier protein [Streptomyces sp. ML-6]